MTHSTLEQVCLRILKVGFSNCVFKIAKLFLIIISTHLSVNFTVTLLHTKGSEPKC